MEAKELINRYVHEVGQHLPRKLRADVMTELQSLLEEALEERAAAAGRSPDEDMAVEVLREFGQPEEVAGRYGPPNRYLVGPAFYPAFTLVLRIVFVVVAVAFLISLFVALRNSEPTWTDLGLALMQLVPQFAGYALMNVGLIALIFTAIERASAGQTDPRPEWDPRQLPAVQDHDRINRGELIVGIVFVAVLMVLFNLFPNWPNYVFFFDGEWARVQILAPEFRVHLPLMNISFLLEIILGLVVLKDGRWKRSTRWWEFGSSILSIIVLYRMITGGPLMAIAVVDGLSKVVLAIILLIALAEALGQIYRLLSREPSDSKLFFETKTPAR